MGINPLMLNDFIELNLIDPSHEVISEFSIVNDVEIVSCFIDAIVDISDFSEYSFIDSNDKIPTFSM